MSAHPAYDALVAHARQTALLASVRELLVWDERTMMPPAAGGHRAEQVAALAGLVHQRQTDPRLGQWLAELADGPLTADPESETAAVVRELRREHDKKVKLPRALVEELTRASVLAQQAWVEARRQDDFPSLRPHLERLMGLKRQQAAAIGYADVPYDALLDDYEPGERTADVARTLAGLRDALVPLLAEVRESPRRPRGDVLTRRYPVEAQRRFGEEAARRIGFSFDRGRLDVTAHPFCSSPGPNDCRITTRYDERHFPGAFFGILHEAGHGIYEQGLRGECYGLPTGEAASLGVHESQSRMWENLVGRSRAFWQWLFPQAQQAFPEALGDVPLDEFYFAINDVRPSLIRVEADEATYNLHILIRFELEQALVADAVQVADLPAAWNDKYRDYLGVVPPGDADGVLQDIHWSAGLVGYFPTYSLGNLYAAQLFEQARRDLGDLDGQFAGGDFAPLRRWLHENVHRHGRRFPPTQLVRRVTGEPPGHAALVRHLRAKLAPLYDLR